MTLKFNPDNYVASCRWLTLALITYMVLTAVVLLNGLVGIFAANFKFDVK